MRTQSLLVLVGILTSVPLFAVDYEMRMEDVTAQSHVCEYTSLVDKTSALPTAQTREGCGKKPLFYGFALCRAQGLNGSRGFLRPVACPPAAGNKMPNVYECAAATNHDGELEMREAPREDGYGDYNPPLVLKSHYPPFYVMKKKRTDAKCDRPTCLLAAQVGREKTPLELSWTENHLTTVCDIGTADAGFTLVRCPTAWACAKDPMLSEKFVTDPPTPLASETPYAPPAKPEKGHDEK